MFEALLDNWRRQGISLRRGASSSMIHLTENRLDAQFPETFRQFYSAFNGFEKGIFDDALLRVWSLEEIQSLPQYLSINDERCNKYKLHNLFVFGDISIEASHVAVELLRTERGDGSVYLFTDEPILVARSFSSFIDRHQHGDTTWAHS